MVIKNILPQTMIIIIIAGFYFSAQNISAQENHVIHRVFSTGNLTDISNINGFNERIENILAGNSDPYTFIINGDLISGEKGEDLGNENQPFKIFLERFQNTEGKIVIIPGDRDWQNSGEKGWKKVKKLEKYIGSLKLNNVKWAIKKGCPGPKIFENPSDAIFANRTQLYALLDGN